MSIIALLLTCGTAEAGRKVVRDPPRTDRPGSDYRRIVLPRPDSELCVGQCLFDSKCAAYSYVRPGVQGPAPLCYLKSAPARKVASGCCESGRVGYVADPRPTPPVRVQPPETLRRQQCEMGLICGGGAKGRWVGVGTMCQCPPFPERPDQPRETE